MPRTEQLMFLLELVISFEVLWGVSCGANVGGGRGRTADVLQASLTSEDFMFLPVPLLDIPTMGFGYTN